MSDITSREENWTNAKECLFCGKAILPGQELPQRYGPRWDEAHFSCFASRFTFGAPLGSDLVFPRDGPQTVDSKNLPLNFQPPPDRKGSQ